MTKLEASHVISSGLNQSGIEMIGAKINSFLSFSQEVIHLSSKVKDTSLVKRLVKVLAILLKSLINLQ